MARPKKITKTILAELKTYFKIGATDEEACIKAGIHPATLYRYQEEHPEFCEEKKALKRMPILKAKHTMVKSLDDPRWASWYLEHTDDEFSNKIKQEIKGNFDIVLPKIEILPVKSNENRDT